MIDNDKQSTESRRTFVKTTMTAGAGLLIVPSTTAFGSQANSSLGLGIIGCGGRGNYDGGEFVKNTDVRVAALMDVFDDRLESTRARFDKIAEEKSYAKLSPSNIFKGWRSYEKLLQSKDVDLVLITSPPYFHPDHLEAAVQAGKHVYLEKPVATDVSGALRVLKAGKQADGKLSIHVGFQKRYDEVYRTVIGRIHAGEIGEIALGQTFYYTNDLDRHNKDGNSELEARIRNWVFDKALSGDILVEQNIHIIDVVNWALKAHPLKATGISGRAVRKEVTGIPGEYLCSDHFILTYYYPGDVHVSFNSNQFKNKGYRQQGERFFGTLGVAETFHSGTARIMLSKEQGIKAYEGETGLGTAVGTKMKALVESIKSGKFENQAELGAESTLTTILGRMAAYSGKEMTWDKMIKTNEKWNLKLNMDSLGNGGTVTQNK
ncbi:MAG: Gfo/Idh/MocA family oxidoreductase [Acidobacteria bacterium]|nr:Gfo/Idh/MocA family oxidoreductase [Acidobacteriota bacterium]